MNVLFLDDCPNRCKSLLSAVPCATIVNTARDCIAELVKCDDWDIVCLDHDLGGETFANSEREDTGMEVVRWVKFHMPLVRRFIVHSMNPGGAANMVDGLMRCGYVVNALPFHMMPGHLQKLVYET
jgi:hypothetical protein